MLSNNLPPLIIGLLGCLFLLLAIFYPWLSNLLGAERSRPERRLLAAVLGIVMLILWSFWYTNASI